MHLYPEISSGQVTIEARILQSKTGYVRYANSLGTTLEEAAVNFEAILREYWRVAGFMITRTEVAGYIEERPDSSVVQVTLSGMSPKEFSRFCSVLRASKVPEVRVILKNLIARAERRYEAKTSFDNRYING